MTCFKEFNNGSKLCILPAGGRVLGLFAPGSEENFFWVNDRPASSNGWWNYGGDRTCLSPELFLFHPLYPDLSTYRMPPEIDPGTYVWSGSALVNEAKMYPPRLNRVRQIRITKEWRPVISPLQDDTLNSRLAFAGYSQRTMLTVSPGMPVSLWNIVHVPTGGEVIVGMDTLASVVGYFDDALPRGVRIDASAVRWTDFRVGIEKIGLPSPPARSRIGNIVPARNAWSLVIRQCLFPPGATWLDVPWSPSGRLPGPACPLQICSVDCELGRYVELEYHSPAIASGNWTDVSELWAFRGSRDDIFTAASTLGVAPEETN